jgi:hypothetical protein
MVITAHVPPFDTVDRQPTNQNTFDPVTRPAHYNNGEIEAITYIKDNLGKGHSYYLEGNVKKYLHRWRYKDNPLQDLKKAQWYLNQLINEFEGTQ